LAKKSLPQQMTTAAADAVKLTDVYFLEALDFSEDSVATVERLVDDVRYSMPGGTKPENIDLLCRVWGAYIGEVFHRNTGGEWVQWKDQSGEAIAFKSGGVTVFPHDKVRKRLLDGPEHNLWDYFQAFRDLMAAGREGS
jgi:Domain of unknown function (DUF3806)